MKKPDRLIKRVSAHLDVLHFPAAIPSPTGPSCLNCASPLSLSQPDLDMPERLLGICEQCKYWFLIDMLPDQTEGTIVRLPEAQVIRSLSRASPSKGISIKNKDD
jgi:hypothetical protein